MVDRYHQQNIEWVIGRAISGGGPLLNLGIHFADLCRVLLDSAEAVGLIGTAYAMFPLPAG